MSILRRLTGRADPGRVRDEMAALKDAERRQRVKDAEKEFRSTPRGNPMRQHATARWQAAALAWLGTATARKIVSEFWRIRWELDATPQFGDDVYAVLASRGRKFFETVARGLLREDGPWGEWSLVRRAVREGAIERPEGDDYVRGMVFGVTPARDAFKEVDATYRGLVADPELLDDDVWRLFEVDAGAEFSGASIFEEKESGKPWEGYTRGDNRWLYALTRLSDEGRLDRQRLLDASLDALMRDFRATTVGWYAKLHEELEPTREERVQRLDRYLGLVTSPAPAVVREGLAALRELEDDVPPEAFARVAPTPFTQRQKNLSTETLSLLARLCMRHPDARPALLGAAAHALAHERTDVQERALKLLEQYADAAPRAVVLGYVEAASPTLRRRLEALTGVEAPAEPAVAIEISAPVQPRLTRELVLDTRPQLLPVESVDELIELAAMLVEGQGTGDDCERFLDGVSRLCRERPRDFARRTAGLAKRAGALTGSWMSYAAGAELVAYVVLAWIERKRPASPSRSETVIGFLAGRAEEVARRAARGDARPLVSFPTHSGGWLEPEVLDGRAVDRAEPHDALQARVRAFPQLEPLAYLRSVRTTERWGQTHRDVVLACTARPDGVGELGPAVDGAGTADEKQLRFGSEVGWAGWDALGVRWALTVLPSLPQVAFAGAARAAIEARDSAVYHQPDTVLEYALDAYVPLGSEAWLATAASLVAKSPDLPRVAADLLVASVEDGRFDADALGEHIAWLLELELAKVNRLEAPLRDVARVSPLHAAQVVRAVEAVLSRMRTPPTGMHALLGVALESATSTGRRIEDSRARATLERIAGGSSASSKVGKLSRSLLA